jgi:hypothetical protein
MRESIENKIVDGAFFLFIGLLSFICFLKFVFRSEERIGVVKEKFIFELQIQEDYPGMRSRSIPIPYVRIANIDGYEKEYLLLVDCEDGFFVPDAEIHFLCFWGCMIIKVFAESAETQRNDFCNHFQET